STPCTRSCRRGTRCTGCCPGSSPSSWISARGRRRSCAGLLETAEEHLGLGDPGVRVADAGGEVVGDVAGHDAGIAPVPGQADLVDEPAVHVEGLEALGDERVHLDGAPRARHRHPVAALDALARGQGAADLHEGWSEQAYYTGEV